MGEDGTTEERPWLTIEEAAAAAGVSRQTVYTWIRRGRLRPRPTDTGTWIDAQELDRLQTARRAAATVGVRIDTVLQWSAQTTADDAP